MSALGDNNTQQELQLRLLKEERLAMLATIEAQEQEMIAMSEASIAAQEETAKYKNRHDLLWTAVERMFPCLQNPNDPQALLSYIAAIKTYQDAP